MQTQLNTPYGLAGSTCHSPLFNLVDFQGRLRNMTPPSKDPFTTGRRPCLPGEEGKGWENVSLYSPAKQDKPLQCDSRAGFFKVLDSSYWS